MLHTEPEYYREILLIHLHSASSCGEASLNPAHPPTLTNQTGPFIGKDSLPQDIFKLVINTKAFEYMERLQKDQKHNNFHC